MKLLSYLWGDTDWVRTLKKIKKKERGGGSRGEPGTLVLAVVSLSYTDLLLHGIHLCNEVDVTTKCTQRNSLWALSSVLWLKCRLEWGLKSLISCNHFTGLTNSSIKDQTAANPTDNWNPKWDDKGENLGKFEKSEKSSHRERTPNSSDVNLIKLTQAPFQIYFRLMNGGIEGDDHSFITLQATL